MELWTIIGLLVVLLTFFVFINSLGKTLPVLEFMLLVAGLQWIVGPFVEYNYPSKHFKYYMYVEESVYMSYVVPAYLLFSGVILFRLFPYFKAVFPIWSFSKYEKYGFFIFSIGFIFDFLGGFLPNSLNFFSFILSNFKYAGAIILYFSNDRRMKILFIASIGYLFYNSLRTAMFHDFILWSTFFYMFWALKHKPSRRLILLTLTLALVFVGTLQTVKATFRSEVWGGGTRGTNSHFLLSSLLIV
ncbi:hypothetical protein GCM10008106_17970 [Mongoliitalea lutea]|uniref:Uncharacterized protein n=2 Tax=Mongoliitalea lutea TaxID=849756 RepID=A0A8J3G5A1_9BACT|nr:hypothetical protein GCM10008106_17970 [Mongoliitalea lutea]